MQELRAKLAEAETERAAANDTIHSLKVAAETADRLHRESASLGATSADMSSRLSDAEAATTKANAALENERKERIGMSFTSTPPPTRIGACNTE